MEVSGVWWVAASRESHHEVPPLPVEVQPDIPEDKSCLSQRGGTGVLCRSKQTAESPLCAQSLSDLEQIPWEVEQFLLW